MSVDMDFYKSKKQFKKASVIRGLLDDWFKEFEKQKLGELIPLKSFVPTNFIVYDWIKRDSEKLPDEDSDCPEVYLLPKETLKILLKKCELALDNYDSEIFFRKYSIYNWKEYVELFKESLEESNKGYHVYCYYSE